MSLQLCSRITITSFDESESLKLPHFLNFDIVGIKPSEVQARYRRGAGRVDDPPPPQPPPLFHPHPLHSFHSVKA